MKKITIKNRELLRNWVQLKTQLKSGETGKIHIADNGDVYILKLQRKKNKPGDCRELLERLKKMGPNNRVKPVKIEWRLHSIPELFKDSL